MAAEWTNPGRPMMRPKFRTFVRLVLLSVVSGSLFAGWKTADLVLPAVPDFTIPLPDSERIVDIGPHFFLSGSKLLTGVWSGRINGPLTVWDPETQRIVCRFCDSEVVCDHLRSAVSADGRRYAYFDITNQKIRVADTDTGAEILAAQSAGAPESVTFFDRGHRLLTTHATVGFGGCRVWDVDAGSLALEIPKLQQSVFSVAEDAGFLAYPIDEGRAAVVDLGRRRSRALRVPAAIKRLHSISISPDGGVLALKGEASDGVRTVFVDTNTGALRCMVRAAMYAGFSRDGRSAILISADRGGTVADTLTGAEKCRIEIPPNATANHIGWRQDGGIVVALTANPPTVHPWLLRFMNMWGVTQSFFSKPSVQYSFFDPETGVLTRAGPALQAGRWSVCDRAGTTAVARVTNGTTYGAVEIYRLPAHRRWWQCPAAAGGAALLPLSLWAIAEWRFRRRREGERQAV